MTFREVETLFHEFGHGLQHMLTQVDYPGAAGINNIEWDAVELPSQFMENWCYHQETLLTLARHYETGEPLPEDLYQKIRGRSHLYDRQCRPASGSFWQVDMELHYRYQPDSDESIWDVDRRIAEQTSVLKPLPEDAFLCAFSHIFAGGYAAGYYSYFWAEVLSADAFAAFEEAGLNNQQAIAVKPDNASANLPLCYLWGAAAIPWRCSKIDNFRGRFRTQYSTAWSRSSCCVAEPMPMRMRGNS
jgi:oligopeptidase A